MSGRPKDRTHILAAPPIEPPRGWGDRQKRMLFKVWANEWPADFFKQANVPALVTAVDAWCEYREMSALVEQEGLILTDRYARRYLNPACVARDRAWTRYREAATKLRLHLSARVRSEVADTASRKQGAGSVRPWEYDPAEQYFDN